MKLIRILVGVSLLMALIPVLPVQAQSVSYRFLNLSSVDSLDLQRNGNPALGNNIREVFSSERVIEAGPQSFQVYALNSNALLAEVSLELEAGVSFILLATEQKGVMTLQAYYYDLSPIPTNRTRIELVHLTDSLPTFSLVGQNGDMLVENAPFGEVTRREIPSGTYQMSFRDAGTGSEVLARPSFDAAQGFVVTVFLYGNRRYFEVRQPVETLAYLRLANASLAADAVDIYLNGELAVENLPYLESSVYLAIPSGDYNIAIFQAGAVPEDSFALWEGLTPISRTSPLTAVIFGENLMRVSINVDDHLQIPAERARLRFVNVAVNFPRLNVTSGRGATVLENLEYALGSRNLLVNTGEESLIFNATQGPSFGELSDFEIEPNHIYTLIATGKPSETGELDLMVLEWSWKDDLDY